ncbi:unnamed protein product [Pleuronectes platessa]|uniref:Uncharacterized protein n=1 Tax=Pleuronectes platessa TaxID=8262 RepID=A0A9N7YDK3_PLEPL|nr:unnamed protein product [Pleuronectes platessa]
MNPPTVWNQFNQQDRIWNTRLAQLSITALLPWDLDRSRFRTIRAEKEQRRSRGGAEEEERRSRGGAEETLHRQMHRSKRAVITIKLTVHPSRRSLPPNALETSPNRRRDDPLSIIIIITSCTEIPGMQSFLQISESGQTHTTEHEESRHFRRSHALDVT